MFIVRIERTVLINRRPLIFLAARSNSVMYVKKFNSSRFAGSHLTVHDRENRYQKTRRKCCNAIYHYFNNSFSVKNGYDMLVVRTVVQFANPLAIVDWSLMLRYLRLAACVGRRHGRPQDFFWKGDANPEARAPASRLYWYLFTVTCG